MSTFTRITPRLPVKDFQRSLAFYRDTLGFRVNLLWPEDAPTFAILDREGVSVGVFVPTPEYPVQIGYAELYLETTKVQSLHAVLKGRLPIEWGPEVYSYGRREFAVRDPDGYLIIFTEETSDPPTTSEPGE
ncbi:MAG: VOC family protein [Terriglobia bacterium]|jgi:catechol 2,3-dioxygenase-like lactoylglutathione lyase family enzyme